MRPCRSDLGPETVVPFVGDMPCLEGGGFGFGVCCAGGCAFHDEVPFVFVRLVATLRQTARTRAGVMSYTGECKELARAGH